MKHRFVIPLATMSLLLVGAGPVGPVNDPGPVPDPPEVDVAGVFPVGVCARVPEVDPRPMCVWIDPE